MAADTNAGMASMALPLEGDADALLDAAQAALAGTLGLPHRRGTRAAALFARASLELRIDTLLHTAGVPVLNASMRSKLICLRTLVSPTIAGSAAVAWGALSNACHQHAYELSPTPAEVTHLIGLVKGVVVEMGAAETAGRRSR